MLRYIRKPNLFQHNVRVVEVAYDHWIGEMVFTCALLGADDEQLIKVRSSGCYKPTKVLNPNDTITIWVNRCDVCVNNAIYFYPPCY